MATLHPPAGTINEPDLLKNRCHIKTPTVQDMFRPSFASQTLSVLQRRSLSVPILKAIGAAGRKGSGLRD